MTILYEIHGRLWLDIVLSEIKEIRTYSIEFKNIGYKEFIENGFDAFVGLSKSERYLHRRLFFLRTNHVYLRGRLFYNYYDRLFKK